MIHCLQYEVSRGWAVYSASWGFQSCTRNLCKTPVTCQWFRLNKSHLTDLTMTAGSCRVLVGMCAAYGNFWVDELTLTLHARPVYSCNITQGL